MRCCMTAACRCVAGSWGVWKQRWTPSISVDALPAAGLYAAALGVSPLRVCTPHFQVALHYAARCGNSPAIHALLGECVPNRRCWPASRLLCTPCRPPTSHCMLRLRPARCAPPCGQTPPRPLQSLPCLTPSLHPSPRRRNGSDIYRFAGSHSAGHSFRSRPPRGCGGTAASRG